MQGSLPFFELLALISLAAATMLFFFTALERRG